MLFIQKTDRTAGSGTEIHRRGILRMFSAHDILSLEESENCALATVMPSLPFDRIKLLTFILSYSLIKIKGFTDIFQGDRMKKSGEFVENNISQEAIVKRASETLSF